MPAWYPNEKDPQLGVFIHKHARAAAMHHHVCVLYVYMDKTFSTRQLTKDGVTIIYATHPPSVWMNFGKKFFKAYRNAIKNLPEKFQNPDIVHTHVADKNVLAAEKFFPKTPKVHTEHWSGFLTGEWQRMPFYKRIMLKVALKAYPYKTAVSEVLYRGLDSIFPNVQGCVLPNVIEASGKLAQPYRGGKLKILTVADLNEEVKQISLIIEACCKIPDSYDIEWSIIGGGPDEYFLKALAKESELDEKRIRFLSRLPNEKVLELIPEYHLMVNVSRYETFGMAICEAIAAGVPVFSTPVGIAPEVINSTNGLLLSSSEGKEPQAPSEDLVVNILSLYEGKLLYDAESVKETLPKSYSLQHVGAELNKIYSAIDV